MNFTSIASLNSSIQFWDLGFRWNVTIAAGGFIRMVFRLIIVKGTSSVNRITIEGVDSSNLQLLSTASLVLQHLSISGF